MKRLETLVLLFWTTIAVTDAVRESYERFMVISQGDIPVHLSWTIEANSAAFAISSLVDGWVALGFSDNAEMIGSHAVIGLLDSFASVQEYDLQGKASSMVTPFATQALFNTAITRINGNTTVSFERPLLHTNGNIDVMNDIVIMWAVHSTQNTLSWHTARDALIINLGSGSTDSIAHPWQLPTHGILMWSSFGLLMPIAILIARFKDRSDNMWFLLHRGLMSLSFVLVLLAAILISSYKASVSTPHFSSYHEIAGIFVVCLTVLQFASGVFRASTDASYRSKWFMQHAWLGRIIFLISTVVVLSGIQLLKSTGNTAFQWLLVLHLIIITLCIGSFGYLQNK